MALTIILACLLIFSISYRTITRRVLPGLLKPDDNRSTPARRYMDSKETLPIPSSLLTVFQFQAISIDPVISPVIALQFGWLPAIIWILIGTLALGWLQSYLVAVISIRSRGSNLVDLFNSLITRKASKLFALLLFMMLFPLIGHLASLSSILINRTTTAPAVLLVFVISLLAGLSIFRWRLNPFPSVLVCTLLVFTALYLSAAEFLAGEVTAINSILGGEENILFTRMLGGGEITWQTVFWSLLVLVLISTVAALPVWKLAAPFNFFTGFLALTLMILAVFGIGVGYFNGTLERGFEIPAFIGWGNSNLGPIWPILFMLLTTGSISGWQALVASQSTSRLVEKETRLLPVSIGAHMISAFLVILVLVLSGTFGVSSGSLDPDRGFRLIAGPASMVAYGLRKVSELIGLPDFLSENAGLFLLAFVYLGALHLAVRYARQLLAWSFGDFFPAFKIPLSGTLLITSFTYVLIMVGLWQWLWPLVAGTALIISGFVLIMCAHWLASHGKRVPWLIWSGIFLFITGSVGVLFESVYKAGFEQVLMRTEQALGTITGNSITLVGGSVILAATAILSRELLKKG